MNKLGGYCETCGGTGRSETGCQPCDECKTPDYEDALKGYLNIAELLNAQTKDPDEPPTHKHKCNTCGFIWEHETHCVNNTDAHTCRECGDQQWWWYNGHESAPFISCAMAS